MLNPQVSCSWKWIVFVSFLLTSQMIEARPFIIDTDMGIDDAMAILYLLQRPDLEVKAITIAADGSAHCQPALLNALGLLKMMRRDYIPVACGQAYPMKGNHHFPKWIIKESDTLAGMAKHLPKAKPNTKSSAVNLLIKNIQNSPEPVTIVALGPLTNIAQALKKAPQIKSHIQSIYIMGGALNVPGNIHVVEPTNPNTTAEWNIYIDPLAAQIVFSQKIPIVLIPLDLTNQHPIDLSFYHSLKQHHSSPAASFVFELLKSNLNMIKTKQWYFWDPLAAVIASDVTIANYKTEKIKIYLKSGMTSLHLLGHKMLVTSHVDDKRFKNLLLKHLNQSMTLNDHPI